MGERMEFEQSAISIQEAGGVGLKMASEGFGDRV